MKAGSIDQELKMKKVRNVRNVLFILFLPVVFGVIMWSIGNIAYKNGWFYMPPDAIKRSILLMFPLTWIYLSIKKAGPRTIKIFSVITGIILLISIITPTIVTTSKYAPTLKFSEEFRVPQGWVEAGEASPYVFFGNLWKKDDANSPITAEDLEKIASENNIKNYTMNGSCHPSPPYLGCSLYGDIDGRDVELRYFDSTYEGEKSTLTLFLREPSPPRGYVFIPYCGDIDLVGEYVSRKCSPMEIAKHLILPQKLIF